jgi:hypothetical protein
VCVCVRSVFVDVSIHLIGVHDRRLDLAFQIILCKLRF